MRAQAGLDRPQVVAGGEADRLDLVAVGRQAHQVVVEHGGEREADGIELGVRFEAEPAQSLRFRMTKGKELKAYSGTYRLMDATDCAGTVVIAELEIDVGVMVPKFMVDKMTRKMMDETGVALRKYIQSAPRASAGAPAVARPAGGKRRRARNILRVTKTPSGYNVWLMGETFSVKNGK